MDWFGRSFQTYFFASALAVSVLPAAFAASVASTDEGRRWTDAELGLSLLPPLGWQVQPNRFGKTLVLQPVPRSKKIKDSKQPIFNPNLTLAVVVEGRPIDELEVLHLRKKLEKDFGQAQGVSNFQVLESRFIDYRRKADGILVYTAFQLNGFPMSQMHIFVSGAKNSALLTYTDLAEPLSSNEEMMTLAWNAMLSTELTGTPPQRYQELIYAGVVFATLLTAGCFMLLLRRRSAYRLYEDEEDKLYRDDCKIAEELTNFTGLATRIATTSPSEQSQALSDLWNLTASQVSTSLPNARKKQVKSAIQSAF